MQTKIPLVGLSACLLLAGWTMSRPAHAQVVMNQASTAGESYMDGLSNIISSKGNYNLSTSQAVINAESARTASINNAKLWTDTYFETRKENKAYREEERGKPPTMEQVARFAQIGMPKRLQPNEFDYVTGRITWPSVFSQSQYDE